MRNVEDFYPGSVQPSTADQVILDICKVQNKSYKFLDIE